MRSLQIDPALLVLLVPLAIVELGLMLFALWDLSRPGRQVRGGSRLVWALVILFVNFIGPIIYFVAGREEAVDETEVEPLPGARPGWIA